MLLRTIALLATISAIPLIAAPDAGAIRQAAQRSIALIEKVNAQWKTPCLSCHHQILGAMALESARRHGLRVDENIAQQSSTRDYQMMHDIDGAVRIDQLIDPAIFEGSVLMGAHAAGVKPNLGTAAYARHVARNQLPNGQWLLFDNRPPQSHSPISATAIAAQGVRLYHPQPEPYVTRARQWLLTAQPVDTEGATFRVLGLLWTGATPPQIAAAAAHLASLQLADGSWRQTSVSKESDAYSTAEALYALRVANAWTSAEAKFQLGIQWLLDHQAADGSWHVKSRIDTPAPISPPYFESGFPYGHDQFLSMAATSWAIRALAEALPEIANPPSPLPLPEFDSSKLSWAQTAMFGSLAELATIDPNSATPGGTTALMMAASDPDRVELLLKRGAKPKAVAKSGYDALMMAALYYGNSKSIELLSKAGVSVEPSRKIRFNATPLTIALITNDAAMVRLLLSKGANPNRGIRLLGGFPQSPIGLASGFGNTEIIRILAKAGARVDAPDADGMTALSTAALSQRAAAAKALLELGANPKHKDRFGLTPVDHTRAIADVPGDTAAVFAESR